MALAERELTMPTPDAPTPAEDAPRPLRWTKAEYYKLAEAGLFEGRRVELIEGEIIVMPPMSEPHWKSILLTEEALRVAFGAGHIVAAQLSFDSGANTEPQPDVAVYVGSIREQTVPPKVAALIVEISLSTLAYDQTTKAEIYARAGVADYWIVNLNNRTLEVRRRPSALPGSPYAELLTLGDSESLAPLAVPQSPVAVADLLP